MDLAGVLCVHHLANGAVLADGAAVSLEAALQFKDELTAMMRRYGLEGDLNVVEALGALDLARAYLIDLYKHNMSQPPPDPEDFGTGEPVPP